MDKFTSQRKFLTWLEKFLVFLKDSQDVLLFLYTFSAIYFSSSIYLVQHIMLLWFLIASTLETSNKLNMAILDTFKLFQFTHYILHILIRYISFTCHLHCILLHVTLNSVLLGYFSWLYIYYPDKLIVIYSLLIRLLVNYRCRKLFRW